MKVGTCPKCKHLEGRHIQSTYFDEGTWTGRFVYTRCDCGCTYYVVAGRADQVSADDCEGSDLDPGWCCTHRIDFRDPGHPHCWQNCDEEECAAPECDWVE